MRVKRVPSPPQSPAGASVLLALYSIFVARAGLEPRALCTEQHPAFPHTHLLLAACGCSRTSPQSWILKSQVHRPVDAAVASGPSANLGDDTEAMINLLLHTDDAEMSDSKM